MRRSAWTLASLLILGLVASACSARPQKAADPTTPAQAYYAAKAAYAPLVKAAAAYRLQCRAKPPELQGECLEVVGHLREIDRTMQGYEAAAKQGLGYGDDALLSGAVAGMELVRQELEMRLAAEMQKG